MKHYGLIGYPLGHSFSKAYFTTKFQLEQIEADYELFSIATKRELENFLNHSKLHAFNVTLPWKEEVAAALKELDSVAASIQAVNCVIKRNQKWYGYNTDVIGFEASLLQFTDLHRKKALVFGQGGSSKAVQFVLNKHQVPFLVIGRTSSLNTLLYQDLTKDIVQEYALWINTTPVGMFPLVEDCLPLPFEYVTHKTEVFDLIYNPEKTRLLTLAERQGARICNGYAMLVKQAEASYEKFCLADEV